MRAPVILAILTIFTAEVGFASMTTSSSMTQLEQSASLRFSNSSLTLSPNQELSLAVIVENAIELAGFDIRFSWNTASLTYITHTLTVPVEDYPDPISPSPYAGILHDPVFVIMDQVNETTGTYWCAASRLVAPFNGSGTIAVFAFRALDQPGSTCVQFTNHELADHKGTPISHTAANLSVNIWRLRVSITSPENKTYCLNSVPLTFHLSKSAGWIGYSLNGQENVTIDGNTTLYGLPDGHHAVEVLASDSVGDEGRSERILFGVDTVPPSLMIVSPENKTYDMSSVRVNFTVNELTSWIGYSLDGEANVTINGSFVLTSLSEGTHGLVVYARDLVGNTGSSSMLKFSMEEAAREPFPVEIVVAIVIAIAVASVPALVFFKRHRPEKKGS